jgi:hypothetical protein
MRIFGNWAAKRKVERKSRSKKEKVVEVKLNHKKKMILNQ